MDYGDTFDVFDVDGDGNVTADELYSIFVRSVPKRAAVYPQHNVGCEQVSGGGGDKNSPYARRREVKYANLSHVTSEAGLYLGGLNMVWFPTSTPYSQEGADKGRVSFVWKTPDMSSPLCPHPSCAPYMSKYVKCRLGMRKLLPEEGILRIVARVPTNVSGIHAQRNRNVRVLGVF